MKKITIITAFLFACFTFHTCYAIAQINKHNGYASLALGYVPGSSSYLSANLTAGRNIGPSFLEYNQIITLSPEISAPKVLQVRTGYSFELDKDIAARVIIGYSLTSMPTDESDRVGHGMTFGGSIIQEVNRDIAIRYELTMSNHFTFAPSIGAWIRF